MYAQVEGSRCVDAYERVGRGSEDETHTVDSSERKGRQQLISLLLLLLLRLRALTAAAAAAAVAAGSHRSCTVDITEPINLHDIFSILSC